MSTPSPRPDVPTSTRPAPQPTHPVAGRTISDETPTFQWTIVPDAEAYQLQLAASEGFETVYYDETVDGPTAVSLDEVLPDDATTVVWRVRAAMPEAPWSSPASFTMGTWEEDDDARFLVDAPPVPIRPISGDAIEAAGATLTWEGVPEASGYRVQVAGTEAFDDPTVDLMLDQDTALTLFDGLPDDTTPLHWRVCALFPNNTEGPWSETVQFRTDPEVDDEAAEPPVDAAAEAEASIRRSAVASGPAAEANTSNAMVVAFIGVLLISFLLTILLIMMAI